MMDPITMLENLYDDAQAEVKRLRGLLEDSYNTHIAEVNRFTAERDEAREVARSFYLHVARSPESHAETIAAYPWLEESDE